MKPLLAFCLFLLTGSINAQSLSEKVNGIDFSTYPTDSIEQLFSLKQYSKDTIAKVAYLQGLSYRNSHKDLAISLFKISANAHSELENFSCRSDLMIAMTYLKAGQMNDAKNHLVTYNNTSCPQELRAVGAIELGILYVNTEDYASAIEFFEEALPILEEEKKYTSFVTRGLYSLGNSLGVTNNTEAAIEKYSQALGLHSLTNSGNAKEKSRLLIARAQEYENKQSYEEAEQDYIDAIKIAKEYDLAEYHFHIKDQLGLLYTQMNEFQKANNQFNQVIAEKEHPDNLRLYSAFANKGDLLNKKGDKEKAIELYNASINEFLSKKKIENPFDIKQMTSAESIEVLCQIIDGYLEVIPSEKRYTQKVDSLMQIIDVAANANLSHASRNSVYEWRKKIKPIYEKGLRFYSSLNDVEQCFYLIENAKAIVQLQEMQQNFLIEGNEEAKKLHSQLIDFEAKLQMNEESEKTKLIPQIEKHKEKIQDYLNQKLEVGTSQNLQLNTVREKLTDQQELYNFFWGNEKLYVVRINKDESSILEIEHQDLQKDIESYIRNVARPYESITMVERQQQLATELANALLQKPSSEELIFLPDGLLNYLPFETLRMNDRFVVEDFNTTYGFSANTYFFDGQPSHPTKRTALAFAPRRYSEDIELQSLENTEELKALKPFRVNSLFDDEAKSERFFEETGKHSLLHFSTHASGGTEESLPWIASFNRKIYLPEIYQLDLDCELAVLSACETNLGEEIQGEGVLSLARGFTIAGAKNVISSQWAVNEKSTGELMKNFYNHLNNNASKANALRSAKLDFISENPTLAKSPYHWAGLIYYGQDGQLEFTQKKKNWLSELIAIFAFLVLFGFYMTVIKRRKK